MHKRFQTTLSTDQIGLKTESAEQETNKICAIYRILTLWQLSLIRPTSIHGGSY